MPTDKTERIGIRMSPEEKEKLIEKAQLSNLSVSQYLLALSEERKLVVNEKIPNLLLEITRIGTNINQIAHVANSQKFVTTKQLDEVIKLMGDVSIYMQKILSEIYNSDEHNFKTLERKIDMLIERTEKNGNS
ncbi:MAG: plasmid mobilization relaxosome protein MobC [Clostridia bacterium]|nr:plasmid mobilization relaxosome protein MobC [Clostridia bacterium]